MRMVYSIWILEVTHTLLRGTDFCLSMEEDGKLKRRISKIENRRDYGNNKI